MMQSVNFYFEEYRPQPLTFDTRFALVALAVSLVMMIIVGAIKTSHHSEQLELLAKKDADLKKLQADQKIIQDQIQSSQELASIDERIRTQQASLNSYRKILANMKQPDIDTITPFSEILKQLGEQKSQSVWLTQINIDSQSLSLQGSAFKSEAIPRYVELLNDSKSLKRQFDELRVERDEEDSRLVNFSLINGRLSDDG